MSLNNVTRRNLFCYYYIYYLDELLKRKRYINIYKYQLHNLYNNQLSFYVFEPVLIKHAPVSVIPN